MMFVCPNCGYRDLPCWKAHRYFLYVVYCRIDELEACNPKLALELKRKRQLEKGPYFYKLGKTGYVLRAPIDLKDFILRRDLIEKYKVRHDPRQQKLLEERRRT